MPDQVRHDDFETFYEFINIKSTLFKKETVKRNTDSENILVISAVTALQIEIDARVVHLYELTEEEYSLILNETKPPDPFRVAALNFYREIARGVLK